MTRSIYGIAYIGRRIAVVNCVAFSVAVCSTAVGEVVERRGRGQVYAREVATLDRILYLWCIERLRRDSRLSA